MQQAVQELDPALNSLSERVIGAAIDVHRELGPGLLESAYEACLAWELSARGIPFRRQVDLAVRYKSVQLEAGYRLDFVVQDALILEIKSVEALTAVHKAQVLTYLKLSGLRLALLINFNATRVTAWIQRCVL